MVPGVRALIRPRFLVAAAVAGVAAGLIGMGLEAGATVGIMAHTSYDWFLLDMAIARAGLISVPIYETSSAEQVEWIVTDADVRVVITESGTLAELVRGAVAGIGHTVRVLALDSDAITTIVQAGSGVSPSQVDQRSNSGQGRDEGVVQGHTEALLDLGGDGQQT